MASKDQSAPGDAATRPRPRSSRSVWHGAWLVAVWRGGRVRSPPVRPRPLGGLAPFGRRPPPPAFRPPSRPPFGAPGSPRPPRWRALRPPSSLRGSRAGALRAVLRSSAPLGRASRFLRYPALFPYASRVPRIASVAGPRFAWVIGRVPRIACAPMYRRLRLRAPRRRPLRLRSRPPPSLRFRGVARSVRCSRVRRSAYPTSYLEHLRRWLSP